MQRFCNGSWDPFLGQPQPLRRFVRSAQVPSGADIDAKTPSGRTPLFWAAQDGAADAVRKLIELGADLNGAPQTEPVFPSTPLARAIALGLDEIADILREAGASE